MAGTGDCAAVEVRLTNPSFVKCRNFSKQVHQIEITKGAHKFCFALQLAVSTVGDMGWRRESFQSGVNGINVTVRLAPDITADLKIIYVDFILRIFVGDRLPFFNSSIHLM